jgi:hypothetical protein
MLTASLVKRYFPDATNVVSQVTTVVEPAKGGGADLAV